MFKIINKTNLSYNIIGNIIDEWLEIDKGKTHYYGQVLYTDFMIYGKNYFFQIRYLKRYTEILIKEVTNDVRS